ncbi:MAG: RNA polymerase sigma factor [Janthinobacterium lividum]
MNESVSQQSPEALKELLERVAGRDGQALRSLYELTSPKLFALAVRIVSKREWAEEVLQDSFVNVWRFAKDYRPAASAPLTWMSAIVRNRALDFLRQSNRLETEWNDALTELIPSAEDDPLDAELLGQQTKRLAWCVERLEANQRQAIALAYLRDYSHSEVAGSMGVPLGTVKSWVRRGLEKLRSCLGGV